MKKKILVTGGAGYIGSHTCLSLLHAGYDVIIADDFSNSREEVIDRIEKISGVKIQFYKCDVANEDELEIIFKNHNINCIIHFAGKKAVGESVQIPLEYYRNNIMTTIALCSVMSRHHVKNIVFSSSATVYGISDKVPFTEDAELGMCTNPYGWTKWMIEQILKDLYISDHEWSIHLLRYFNPVGAHPSGLIGEDPKGIPNNLMPYITQLAVGRRDELQVYGNDYPTHDGTGVRDYIHVMDLAEGHVASVTACIKGKKGVEVINLGTGKGFSVLDVLHAFEKAVGRTLPYSFNQRRAGDIAICYASTEKAKNVLNWEATRNIDEMCNDAWRWQQQNPNGYDSV